MLEQIIGFIALLTFIVSYQIKSNKALYLTQTAGVLLFALQFALLGAWVGCLSLPTCSALVYGEYERQRSNEFCNLPD